ncbi:hypothetical protein BraRD5C2_02770 [Bradyrhizobium sp. RD5-C2]|nr:hypothetical protein BraRD5C2_02770 [Bradyrhizobium sp. RD5-C2]
MHIGGNSFLGLGKGRHMIDDHVVALQRLRQRRRHFGLVFNQQYPHVLLGPDPVRPVLKRYEARLSHLLEHAPFRKAASHLSGDMLWASNIATTLRKWPLPTSRGAMSSPPQDSLEPAGYNRPYNWIWEDCQ